MDRKVYIEKLDAQLKEWNARINELKARAEGIKEEKRKEYLQQLEILRGKQEMARKKLRDLTEASNEAWQSMTAGVELAWKDLKTAMQNATEQFK